MKAFGRAKAYRKLARAATNKKSQEGSTEAALWAIARELAELNDKAVSAISVGVHEDYEEADDD